LNWKVSNGICKNALSQNQAEGTELKPWSGKAWKLRCPKSGEKSWKRVRWKVKLNSTPVGDFGTTPRMYVRPNTVTRGPNVEYRVNEVQLYQAI
jgi:hypothetical protein